MQKNSLSLECVDVTRLLLHPTQLAEAKRKSDDDQTQMEELRGGRKKLEKDMEALREKVDELTTENQRVTRSKKKIQEEVNCESVLLLLGAKTTSYVSVAQTNCICFVAG